VYYRTTHQVIFGTLLLLPILCRKQFNSALDPSFSMIRPSKTKSFLIDRCYSVTKNINLRCSSVNSDRVHSSDIWSKWPALLFLTSEFPLSVSDAYGFCSNWSCLLFSASVYTNTDVLFNSCHDFCLCRYSPARTYVVCFGVSRMHTIRHTHTHQVRLLNGWSTRR
jgi:hypothetical protein